MLRSTFRRGYREWLGVNVRSQWEANVLLWLNHKRVAWDYEPRIFYFEKIKRGTRSYTPDIWLPNYKLSRSDTPGHWLEIKGQLTPRSRTALKRFAKYYPEEFNLLIAIVQKSGCDADLFFQDLGVPIMAYYNDITKKFSSKLRHWGE